MGKEICLPNFLVVGTAKSGTTSLFHYLNQHPDIHLPIKESHLFNDPFLLKKDSIPEGKKDRRENVENLDQYKKIFSFDKRPAKLLGEIGTGYLYDYEYAIPKIKQILGDIPIIIVLRNPIDRAYSSFQHTVKLSKGDHSFEESLKKEEERIKNGWHFMWHHAKLGYYAQQVSAYQDAFSKVRIAFFEDLEKDSDEFMRMIIEFIGANANININTSKVFNRTTIPKSLFFRFINSDKNPLKIVLRPIFRALFPSEKRRNIKEKVRSYKSAEYSEMRKETKKRLIALYRDDIGRLEKIVQRDLSIWLK